MNQSARAIRTRSGVLALVLLRCFFAPGLHAETGALEYAFPLPALNPAFPPSAVENRPLLRDRLIAAFERDYAIHQARNEGRSLSEGMTIYHVQRELQAGIDMWRATSGAGPEEPSGTQDVASADLNPHLDRAMNLVLRAIEETSANPRPLLWHGESRGDWPCFYLDAVVAETGGHNQLCDFQGSAGFLMVARALRDLDVPAWTRIADFVERDIVQKWLYYKPSITREHLTGPESYRYLLTVLNSARDVREHFACICLDLDALGYRSYPYRDWASLLVELYLTPRYDPNQLAPYADRMPERIPPDWGLLTMATVGGATWLSIPDADPNNPIGVLDTSHANRTTWLAARAHAEGLVDRGIVAGLANTFRYQIWAPEKGPFYFNNYVDGSDYELDGLEPGRGGNIWFGWHRLAAYHSDLEELFLLIAYDLTDGGPNLPDGSQNKTMQEAPLCLEAWAARLLSTGQTGLFP